MLEELLCEALICWPPVFFGLPFHHLGTLDLDDDGFLTREELDGVQEAGGGCFEKANGLMGEKRYLGDLLLLGLSLVIRLASGWSLPGQK